MLPFIGWTRKAYSMLALYITYLLLGGLIFMWLEQDMTSTNLVRNMVQVLRSENFSDEEIALTFKEKNYVYKQSLKQSMSWMDEYGDKFLFSMILITTIGYGNVSPKGMLGKLVCIVYTLLGLSLNVTFLRLLSLEFRWGLRRMLQLPTTLRNTKFILALGSTSFFTFFSGLFIFGPAAVFDVVEPWTYAQAVYYCFISLATIGLGDYVAGVSSKLYLSSYYPLYIILMFIWLLFGLAYVSLTLNLLSYVLGLLLLDKLDCRCHQRAITRKAMNGIYNLTAELNYQLAKYTPEEFTNWKKAEEFMARCVENPQHITVEDLKSMFALVEELREKACDEIVPLNIPDRFKALSLPDTKEVEPSASFLPSASDVSTVMAPDSEPDCETPTIVSVLSKPETSPRVESPPQMSSTGAEATDSEPVRRRVLVITEEILALATNSPRRQRSNSY